mmetsp:Transcript_34263/g.25334  ORF Transcript_34263/g.25334 Transcript_34263/m.25334 type:complete len:93 (+) Transcript_34263:3844-4122(+)
MVVARERKGDELEGMDFRFHVEAIGLFSEVIESNNFSCEFIIYNPRYACDSNLTVYKFASRYGMKVAALEKTSVITFGLDSSLIWWLGPLTA